MVVKRSELTAMQDALLQNKEKMDKLKEELHMIGNDSKNLPDLDEYIPALLTGDQWAREVYVRAFIIGTALNSKSTELKTLANQTKILMKVCTPKDIKIFEEAINGSLELI